MTDPAILMGAIDVDCRSLDAAGKELGRVIASLSDAELAYGDAFEDELALLVEEHKEAGERLPGEDVRRALIHKRIDRDLWRTVRRLERRKEALEKWAKKTESALSARQSQLSFLKAEGQAPEQPQWGLRDRGRTRRGEAA